MVNEGDQGKNCGVVRFSELGTNCWDPKRFVQGGQCERVHACDYPEKAKCKAIQAEIDFLSFQIIDIQETAMKHQQKNAQLIREFMGLQGKK